MDTWQSSWKSTSQHLTLLRSSPEEFIQKYGYVYGLAADM
jgi:hypothetical protein